MRKVFIIWTCALIATLAGGALEVKGMTTYDLPVLIAYTFALIFIIFSVALSISCAKTNRKPAPRYKLEHGLCWCCGYNVLANGVCVKCGLQ